MWENDNKCGNIPPPHQKKKKENCLLIIITINFEYHPWLVKYHI